MITSGLHYLFQGTNRALLQWLKMWDKVVFNIERKVKAKPKEDTKGKGKCLTVYTGIFDISLYDPPCLIHNFTQLN